MAPPSPSAAAERLTNSQFETATGVVHGDGTAFLTHSARDWPERADASAGRQESSITLAIGVAMRCEAIQLGSRRGGRILLWDMNMKCAVRRYDQEGE
jgi:hypothetical protein